MTGATTTVEALRAARAAVLERIAAACERVGRDPVTVQLVAVSKTVGPDRLVAAVEAGLTTLAENRVQEGEAKVSLVPGATWHLVGPLQSNKAKRALEAFDVIQTVDSIALAERLDRLAGEVRGATRQARYPVLLQVNVDDDASKAGFAPAALEETLVRVHELEALEVRGLMTNGRLVADAGSARPTFRALRELSGRLRDRGAAIGPDLSMGMTDDFEVAIEEGATIVRIGRALFGERPHQHGRDDVPHRHGTNGSTAGG
jgi:pyridoxal phosphate enzyme (YggS family)